MIRTPETMPPYAQDELSAPLHPTEPTLSIRERLQRLRQNNPVPPKTGLAADKAFFDDLSGEAD